MTIRYLRGRAGMQTRSSKSNLWTTLLLLFLGALPLIALMLALPWLLG